MYQHVVLDPSGASSPVVGSLTPQQIRGAYGINSIKLGSLLGDGSGQTIAIVDAYDDPALVSTSSANFASSDLHRFDLQFGLPDPPCFLKLDQSGGTNYPMASGTSGWAMEESLDVEWAHAIAPKANIILFEASSVSDSALTETAVNTARNYNQGGLDVSVVSMSYGESEFSGEQAEDTYFATPSGHQGVTFVAATGDWYSPGIFPAFSPNVLAAGGTSLTVSGNTYVGETAWDPSGGGASCVESEPGYQAGVQQSGSRDTPDVAFEADPNTGVAVCDSYDCGPLHPWTQVGGTSLATPCWSGLIAIADQLRVSQGQGTLDGPTQTIPAMYSLPAADFHDITSGNNGGYSAGPGYDEVTGLGSPRANLLIPALASANWAATTTTLSTSSGTHVYGKPVTLTATVGSTGGTPNDGTATFRAGIAVLGTAPVVNGIASLTTTALSAGFHPLSASYSGDAASYSPSGAVASPTITTIAGGGYGDGGPATAAPLDNPGAVAEDASGDVFIADPFDNVVREVSASGTISTVAGDDTPGYSGDGGPGNQAQLYEPSGLALDGGGDLFIADTANGMIRAVNLNNGQINWIVSGAYDPVGLAAGYVNGELCLFFCESAAQEVWEVNFATNTFAQVAGDGTAGYSGNGGSATSAELFWPTGLALDSTGSNLYIADTENNRIREVDLSTGIISTVAGNGTAGYTGDGSSATAAELNNPTGVAVDTSGNLYIADTYNSVIRKVTTAGVISTVAGSDTPGYAGDGSSATAAELDYPQGVAADGSGKFWIADTGNHRVRAVSSGTIRTLAGNGTVGYSGDGGSATAAGLDGQVNIAVDNAGDLFVAEPDNRVREVSPSTGIITTIAGTGTAGDTGDGHQATAAEITCSGGLSVDNNGDLFIAGGNVVREVNLSSGVITSVVGINSSWNIVGLAADSAGNLFVADGTSETIFQVNVATGADTAIATDDNIGNLAVDNRGHLFYCDDDMVRQVTLSTGAVATVAGGGSVIGDGGPATAAALYPTGIAADSAGDLFIAEASTEDATSIGNARVYEVNLASGIITTIAGNGYPEAENDAGSLPAGAWFNGPEGIGLDANGDIFIADAGNTLLAGEDMGSAHVCEITSSGPSLTINPASLTIAPNSQTMVASSAVPAFSASYSGFQNGDTAASLGMPATLSTTATSASGAGNYPITASGAVDPDYTIGYTPGILTIIPQVITTPTTAGSPLVLGTGGGVSVQTGGTLTVPGISAAPGATGVDLNGGTLQGGGSFSTSVPVTVDSGGGTVDSNGDNLTLDGTITGAGGLTVIGEGSVTVTGSDVYSGPTTVQSATLVVLGAQAVPPDGVLNVGVDGSVVLGTPGAAEVAAVGSPGGGSVVPSNAVAVASPQGTAAAASPAAVVAVTVAPTTAGGAASAVVAVAPTAPASVVAATPRTAAVITAARTKPSTVVHASPSADPLRGCPAPRPSARGLPSSGWPTAAVAHVSGTTAAPSSKAPAAAMGTISAAAADQALLVLTRHPSASKPRHALIEHPVASKAAATTVGPAIRSCGLGLQTLDVLAEAAAKQ
jgi:sugar lactone lactonase YvrE